MYSFNAGKKISLSFLTIILILLASSATILGANDKKPTNSAANRSLSSLITATFTITNTNDSGAGSLRQAIIDANISPGDDTITFQNGVNTITLTSGELLINSNITISGTPSSSITITRSTTTGTPNFRIFNIEANATVVMSNLTISGGILAVTGFGTIMGGGIFNAGTLSVINSTIIDNRAIGTGDRPSCFGGGIYNTGTLTLTTSIVGFNLAVCGSFNNSTGRGGGIYNSGTLTITDTEITGNRAEGSIGLTSQGDGGGGGIFSIGSGSVSLTRCSVNNNSCRATRSSGGGISGGVNLSNSTISNNSASSSGSVGFVRGGGITGNGSISNSTISSNSISGGGQDRNLNGGGGISGGFRITNTIISNNTTPSSSNFTDSPNVFGAVTSQGYNLISNTAGSSGWIATDLINVGARLTPLGNYGGLTQTVALLPDSPAFNAGNNANAPATDQRGFTRIVGGVIDIGAFEGDISCVFTISSTNQFIGNLGGNVNVNVNGGVTCSRTAISNVAWISVTSGSSGNGPGVVIIAVQANTGAARTGTITIAGQTFTIIQASGTSVRQPLFDFDGDGRSDISVYRPSNGVWYLFNSQAGFSAAQFGISNAKSTPADFDGDDKTDIALYLDGFWYLLRSMTGFTSVQFGLAEDIPVPADYDGDGKADIAVYRPSNGTWYFLNSNSNNSFSAVQFGISEDKPTIGDFDGDGKSDIALYRPSNGFWYRLNSGNGSFSATQFGISEDRPVAADYDGDGKADIAVFRPSNGIWYRLNSFNNQFVATQFGISEDKPTAADYDGDGKAEIAVYRPSSGIWYLLNSTTGFTAQQFGISEDKPAPNAFVR